MGARAGGRVLVGEMGRAVLLLLFFSGAGAQVSVMLTSNSDLTVPSLVGCSAEVPLMGDPSADSAMIDTSMTPMLPVNMETECQGLDQVVNEMKVCGRNMTGSIMSPTFVLRFSPSMEQVGLMPKVCVKFAAGLSEGTKCIVFNVSAPQAHFTMTPMQTFFTFRVGCPGMLQFKAMSMVTMASHPVPMGTSRMPMGCGYTVSVGAVASGSFPPSATGLPAGVEANDGTGMMAGAGMLMPGMGDDPMGERSFDFKWTPARGHESSVPYRTCFKAMDDQGIGGQVMCYSIKVQKCQYCSQAGDSFNSLAAQFDTDWLHLYTTNPTIRDPDSLAPGEKINTGVLYEVRTGDYIELLAQKFFTSTESIYSVNPDLRQGQDLIEGDEVCILPPVCGVVCEHGLDCHPAV